jgi:hypothetical protein
MGVDMLPCPRVVRETARRHPYTDWGRALRPEWEGDIALDTPGYTAAAGGPPGPVMPARRPRWDRVQLNARVRVEVEQLLQRFVDDHDTTLQNSVDLALVEFLAARGYVLPTID